MDLRIRVAAVAVAFLSLVPSIHASRSDSVPVSLVGGVITYVARQGDTLGSIAARVGTDVAALALENSLPSNARLFMGQRLYVDNRHIVPSVSERGILINIPQRMIFNQGDDGVLEAFPVAVGRRTWPTPVGVATIAVKERKPTWDVPESIRQEALRQGRQLPEKVPPGPNNPLGAFWLGLSSGGVGVHGTNAPGSIYRAATHGCVRLHPDDIAQLFDRVQVGTAVRIVYEPVLLAAVGDVVFLEVHSDVYGRLAGGAPARARALAAAAGLTDRIDWTIADAVLAARHGIARDVTRHQSAPQ